MKTVDRKGLRDVENTATMTPVGKYSPDLWHRRRNRLRSLIPVCPRNELLVLVDTVLGRIDAGQESLEDTAIESVRVTPNRNQRTA